MLDSLVHGIDRGIRSLSEIFYGPVGSYCKLETVDRDALVADDGSLITVLRLEGALKQVGVDEHRIIMRGLTAAQGLHRMRRECLLVGAALSGF